MTTAGLPEAGPGSVAPAGPRLGAFLVDVVLSSLIAALFTAPDLPPQPQPSGVRRAVFRLHRLVGQTPGMRLREAAGGRGWTGRRRSACGGPAVRTLGVILLIPALIRDREGAACTTG